MQKKIAGSLVVVMVLVTCYWGYHHYSNGQTKALTASGTIEATTVQLAAKVAGTIENISVEPGDLVKKGQVAAKISRNDLVAQRERDALAVLKAEAQLADLTSGSRQQEVTAAEANVNIAETNYQKALADYQRAEQLFNADALAQAEFEKIQSHLNLTKNQLTAANAKLSLMRAGNRENIIKAAQMEVERNRAILKAAESQLADTKIISPINGTVLTKNFEVGEFAPLGASIVTVADLDNMWIKVYLPTDDLPQIKLGQRVHFTVSGSPEQYNGTIMEIASKGEFTPKTIQTKEERTNIVYGVKIKVNNQQGVLKPGMPADVSFN
ncbi:efflux RND transporter periplasmic adaptor subunit [Peptococcaceae bacterium 1198_IL3148]